MYYWTSSIFNLCFGDCHCFINVSAIIDIWDVIAFVDVVKLWLPMLNFFLRCQSFGRINFICPYLSCIGVFLLSICLLFIEGLFSICSLYCSYMHNQPLQHLYILGFPHSETNLNCLGNCMQLTTNKHLTSIQYFYALCISCDGDNMSERDG